VRRLLGFCANPNGVLTEVNAELRRIWEEETGHDPYAGARVEAIDGKIANIRRAIEDGLSDAAWANTRLKALLHERESLVGTAVAVGEPPQIDIRAASEYRRRTEKTLKHGEMVERKRLLRTWVSEVKLPPEQQQVEVTYRIPEPVMNGMVAGARCKGEEKTRFRRWIVETAFRMSRRLVETVSRGRRVIVDQAPTDLRSREVAGSNRGRPMAGKL